jgi:integrase/recombinase XerD
MRGPAGPPGCPHVLTRRRSRALLDAARHGRGEAERLRNTCLMELLYATGLRVSELVGLPVAAARGDPRMLLVRGKGGKERMVPLSRPARAALAAWLAERDAAEAGREAPPAGPPRRFSSPRAGQGGHLTRRGFSRADQGPRRGRRPLPAASPRTGCATPSPRICWPAAPICG